MKNTVKLTELDQVKALADPLRLRVLEVLCQKPMTTKQVALQLGEKPTKLYHHIDLLDRAGLIVLVTTRKKRGAMEKYYKSVAKEIAIDRRLLAITPRANEALGKLHQIFTKTLEGTMDEINKSISSDLIRPKDRKGVERLTLLARAHISATQVQIKRLIGKLQEWINECRATDSASGDVRYGLTVLFYPVSENRGKKRMSSR